MSTSDRSQLAFVSSAKSAFQFLITEYGFSIIEEEPTFIRYETTAVFINIYHGRQSYEIGFECGLKRIEEASRYRLPVILLGLLGEKAREIRAYYQANEQEVIANCLVKLASLVKDYCSPVLQGDDIAFARIANVSSSENRALTEKYSIDPIKRKAEAAWSDKNYEKVISLYGSIKGSLSEIEKKRFDYACKRIEI